MTDLTERLSRAGIRLNRYSVGNHKTLCPQCSHMRKPRNRNDPCLSVTIEHDGAVWRCHNCGWAGAARDRDDAPSRDERPLQRHQRPKEPPRKPDFKPSPETLTASALRFFTERGISEATVRRNRVTVTKVRMPQHPEEGAIPVLAFPCLWNGEVVNVKYRDRCKHFRQEHGARKILFGMDDVPADADTLIWVEGELDKMACNEAGIWNVVSVPDGAPAQFRWENADRKCQVHRKITDPSVKVCPGCGAKQVEDPRPEEDAKFEYLWNCREFIDRFPKHVLAVDADGPGSVLEEELARRLGKERCWRVRWPDAGDAPCKDANEVLQDHGAQVLRECIDLAEPYPIEGVYRAEDYAEDVLRLYRLGRQRGLSTGWPALDELYTVVPGQLTIVTGFPGSGKSEWVDALMVNLARMHGWMFGVCSFENPPDEHIAKWAEKYIGAPFYDGPTLRMQEHELLEALAWVNDHMVLIRCDDGSPTVDWALDRARAAVMRYGIRGLVLDPYNEFEHSRPARMTETEYISQMLGKVTRFAKNHGVHVWFVAHPAKPERKELQNEPPSLYDISGGAHWFNKADMGVTVHRPFTSEGTRSNRAMVCVKKVRFKWAGRMGVVEMDYNPATGTYTPAGPAGAEA